MQKQTKKLSTDGGRDQAQRAGKGPNGQAPALAPSRAMPCRPARCSPASGLAGAPPPPHLGGGHLGRGLEQLAHHAGGLHIPRLDVLHHEARVLGARAPRGGAQPSAGSRADGRAGCACACLAPRRQGAAQAGAAQAHPTAEHPPHGARPQLPARPRPPPHTGSNTWVVPPAAARMGRQGRSRVALNRHRVRSSCSPSSKDRMSSRVSCRPRAGGWGGGGGALSIWEDCRMCWAVTCPNANVPRTG